MISIAIDGPAGAGKSSVSKAVARKLGFIHVDTGALYRTVAVHLVKNNIDVKNIEAVEKSLLEIDVTMDYKEDGQHMYLCGEDVTTQLRTPEVSMMASTSSAIPSVRAFLLKLQTDMAKKYNVVMDGRDIGTVILPNAQVKVFLTASAHERARRRTLELKEKGIIEDFDKVLKEIEERDFQDSNREIAPLKAAEDAVVLDSTGLTLEQAIEKFVDIVRLKTEKDGLSL